MRWPAQRDGNAPPALNAVVDDWRSGPDVDVATHVTALPFTRAAYRSRRADSPTLAGEKR